MQAAQLLGAGDGVGDGGFGHRRDPTGGLRCVQPARRAAGDRALELLDRRVLDALDADRPVQPRVDLAVRARGRGGASSPTRRWRLSRRMLRRSNAGRRGRLVGRRHGGGTPAAAERRRGATGPRRPAAEQRHLRRGARRRDSGTNSTAPRTARSARRSRARRTARLVARAARRSTWRSSPLDLRGVARAAPGRPGRYTQLVSAGRPAIVRTKRPTIWRKISGVLAASRRRRRAAAGCRRPR